MSGFSYGNWEVCYRRKQAVFIFLSLGQISVYSHLSTSPPTGSVGSHIHFVNFCLGRGWDVGWKKGAIGPISAECIVILGCFNHFL